MIRKHALPDLEMNHHVLQLGSSIYAIMPLVMALNNVPMAYHRQDGVFAWWNGLLCEQLASALLLVQAALRSALTVSVEEVEEKLELCGSSQRHTAQVHPICSRAALRMVPVSLDRLCRLLLLCRAIAIANAILIGACFLLMAGLGALD
jgi:hypothetical protein